MGANDVIISNSMSREAATKFTSPVLVTSSTAGHHVPYTSDPTFAQVVSFLSSAVVPEPTPEEGSGGMLLSSPPPPERLPCFPSSAMVTLANGTSARMDTLREGDEIIVATAAGGLTTDIVSLFSLADHTTVGSFVRLTTEGNASLALTPTHHLSVGSVCCAILKQALDVKPGDTVWVVEPSALKPRPHVVTGAALEQRQGLHSPLPMHGTFPVVDGVVTSFNTLALVVLDGVLLPLALPICKATSSCGLLRSIVAWGACASRQVLGERAAACKRFIYVDNYVAGRVDAGGNNDSSNGGETGGTDMVGAAVGLGVASVMSLIWVRASASVAMARK